MTRFYLFFAIFVLISLDAFSQVQVRIIVHTKLPDDSAKVYIAGNNQILGNWNPGSVVLEKKNDSTWEKIFNFRENESIEFKFTLGNWSREGIEKKNVAQNNYSFQCSEDTSLEYNINFWGAKSRFQGQVTGKVILHRRFPGAGLLPRDIAVLLPPGYSDDTTRRYPVIYAHDGQNLFDPQTSSFGIDWQIDETADSLAKNGKMRPVIIVGIYNTQFRSREYSYSDSGYAYMNFIINELKPFIDKTYRTLTDRENTATLGSSLGGLISFMLLWEHTDVFSMAASFSPALKIRDLNYLPFIENYQGPKKNLKLYIDNGGIGLEQNLQPGIDETVALLQKKGYKPGSDFIVFYDKDAQHNESAWAERVWRPLLFFFGIK